MSTINSKDLGSFSKQYSAKDLPGHTKLKYRDIGQAAPEEVRKDKKDIRKELDERERLSRGKDSKPASLSLTEKGEFERASTIVTPSSSGFKKPKLQEPVNLDADEVLSDDSSDEDNDDRKHKHKRNEGRSKEEEDDSDNSDNDSADEKDDLNRDEDDDDENDDDDDDDTEALMAELNRIKQERAAEAARLEAERKTREEKIRVESILRGNPLLNSNPSTSKDVDFKVRKRWDDDVVFKNCAKMDDPNTKPKGFINDTLRSEFHKKFMDRYIK